MYSNPSLLISNEEAVEIHKEYVQMDANKKSYKKKAPKFSKPKNRFDPNKYRKEDWLRLGLSDRQTDVILSFTKRGVSSVDDLKKIFVLPDELFQLIKDSLIFESNYEAVPRIKSTWSKKEEFVPIDLNLSDQTALETIPGIGKYFADKIIQYRTNLGGFSQKEQLLEVWNFDSEKYNQIKDFIFVEQGVKQLNIRSATFEELKSHPYISYKVANSIVKMREQEMYKNVEDIKRSKLIDEELYIRLKPYLAL